MHQIRIQNTLGELPDRREEFTRRQFRAIAEKTQYRDSPELRMAILKDLLPRRLSRYLGDLDGAQLWELGELVAWIWERPEITDSEDIYPFLSHFQFKGRTWWLPEHSLNDITVGEWAYIDLFLQEMLEEIGDISDHLVNLAAVICRPRRSWWTRHRRDFDGYPREYFNPERIEGRIEQFNGLPLYVRLAVQDYVLRAREMITARYAVMFQGSTSEGGNFGWKGIMLSLAEAQVFGREREVQQTNIHDVCLFCCKKKIEMQALEQQFKPITP